MFCTSVIVPRSCVCQCVFKHVGAHHAFVGVNACLAARAMRVKVCLCVCVCVHACCVSECALTKF